MWRAIRDYCSKLSIQDVPVIIMLISDGFQVIRVLVTVLTAFVICWTPQEIIVFMDANWPDTMTQVRDSCEVCCVEIKRNLSKLLGDNMKMKCQPPRAATRQIIK